MSSILNEKQLKDVLVFHSYCMYAALGYCAVCIKVLYPDMVKFSSLDIAEEDWPCVSWDIKPLTSWPKEWKEIDNRYGGSVTKFDVQGIIVCNSCGKLDPPFTEACLRYPGKIMV